MAAEQREQKETGTDEVKNEKQETSDDQTAASEASNGAAGNGSSALRTAATAGALAAAAGTTVYVTRRVLRSEPGAQAGGEATNRASSAASSSGGRFDTFLSTLNSQGLAAAANMLIPVAENAAHAAGVYAADKSPDVVADRILPRFVDGFNEARGNAGDKAS